MGNDRTKLGERAKKTLSLLAIAAFLAFTLAVFWFVGRPLVKNIGNPELFREWVDSHGLYGRLAFVGAVVMQVFIAIIPGEPFEIFAGYAFGVLEGTLLCVAGIALGSALVFAFVRKFGVKAVEVFFSREKINSLRFLNDPRKLNALVFIVFAIPGTPKDLLCYFVGLTRMKFSTWMLITLVARLPSILTSTAGGDALGLNNYLFAAIVFAATLVISAAGLLIYNRISAKKRPRPDGAGQKPPPEENV